MPIAAPLRSCVPVLVVAVLATSRACATGAPDSPMFRGDPRHLGRCDATALPRFTQVRWKFRTHAPVFSTPAVVAGTAYVGSADGSLYAVDTANGRERWRFATGSRVNASPAVAGGLVYFGSDDGGFYAVAAASGRLRWKFATLGEHRFTATHLHGALPAAEAMPDPFDVFLSSPCVVGGVVYFGSGDGHVYALDARTGALRWKYATGDVVHASPAVADGLVLIGSWDHWFYALDAATGALRWKFATGQDPDIHNQVGISSSASVVDGTVYVGCRDGHLYALDEQTGRRRWAFSTQGAWVSGSPVVADGVVWFGSGSDKRFLALDARTGAKRYEQKLARGVFASATVAGGLVFVGGLDGKLSAVERASGRTVYSFQTPEAARASAAYAADLERVQADTLSTEPMFYDSMVRRFGASLTGSFYGSPVVVGTALYIGSTDGCLYALAGPRAR